MHGFPAKWKSDHVRSQLAGNMTLYRCPPNWKCKHPIMQFPVSWKFKLYNILLVSYVEGESGSWLGHNSSNLQNVANQLYLIPWVSCRL